MDYSSEEETGHTIPPSENTPTLPESTRLPPQPARRRKRREELWKVNRQKEKRRHGKAYTDRNGKLHAEKTITTTKDCAGRCRFKCSIVICESERRKIHDTFWKQSLVGQQQFYARTTKQARNNSRRKRIEYTLHIASVSFRVCKEYYLTTLGVSQQRVNRYHQQKDEHSYPKPLTTGNNNKRTSEDRLDRVRKHIMDFPKVESHYCRENTEVNSIAPTMYIDPIYSITSMHAKYAEQCREENLDPVHFKIYSNIFVNEFKVKFTPRKKDRCDKCEIYTATEKRGEILTAEAEAEREAHNLRRVETAEERTRDTEANSLQNLVISFDLENVFSLPRAEISSFFYKRKLSVYNLTGITRVTKRPYCAIWPETMSGRSGNDIASALVDILNRVVADHSAAEHLTLWSDSCVPQNRNSNMSTGEFGILNPQANFK